MLGLALNPTSAAILRGAESDPEPSGPITIFEASPALNANDNNANCNFRVISTLNDVMGDEFRITIVPAMAGNPLTSAHVGLGRYDGSNPAIPNMLEAPIEALFEGNSGFAGATTPQVSDWMPASFLEGMVPGDQVMATYTTGGAGQAGQRYGSAANATSWFKSDPDVWDDSTVSGFDQSLNNNFSLGKIETRWIGSAPPPGTTIPMSFDSPVFSNMRELTSPITLANGQNLSNRSIVDDDVPTAAIVCIGNNIIDKCRVMANEAIRLTGGTVVMNQCYFEAEATNPEAHADTIQTYSPGDNGDFMLSNSYIKAYNTYATANWFTADDWSGTIRLDNVLIDGGPYGFRVNIDPDQHIDLYLKDVYFVGPFGFDDILIQDVGTGTHTIHQWDNVRHATIVDGVLVPGEIIPSPEN